MSSSVKRFLNYTNNKIYYYLPGVFPAVGLMRIIAIAMVAAITVIKQDSA